MTNDIMDPLADEGQHAVRITICDHGQVIDARERFFMKALADEERRKVDQLIANHRALVAATYPQSDSGDETDHFNFEGC